MQKTFVIGDIHGGLKALIQILDRAKVMPDDQLIFLGDYVDRWYESAQTIDFLINFQKTHNCIFIRGNHDDLLQKYLEGAPENTMWLNAGGAQTIKSYQNTPPKNKYKHLEFLKSLKSYYLDNQQRLFVHGGFTHMRGVRYEWHETMLYWDRTLWETALSLNPALQKTDLYYPKRLKLYHEIYIGHTATIEIAQTTPQNCANVWNIDTGAGYVGKLTIMNIDTKEFWQSDQLNLLYQNF
jgi:serine/threonine protein phosphatase 1